MRSAVHHDNFLPQTGTKGDCDCGPERLSGRHCHKHDGALRRMGNRCHRPAHLCD